MTDKTKALNLSDGSLGRAAYSGWCDQFSQGSYAMPAWDALEKKVQLEWIASARNVLNAALSKRVDLERVRAEYANTKRFEMRRELFAGGAEGFNAWSAFEDLMAALALLGEGE